jgi:hypothetical protein
MINENSKSPKNQVKDLLSPRFGCLPDFLIIGAQKCGTTSLFNYLKQHPDVFPPKIKEVGYFDRYYNHGLNWYRSNFPFIFTKVKNRMLRKNFMTFEASTGYILNPNSLKRIKNTIPKAKLILMIRNPVDRAYSHYRHSVRMNKEDLPFHKAIKAEKKRIGHSWEKYNTGIDFYDLKIAFYSYLRTGIYADQIENLFRLFPRNQIHIIKSEDFFRKPSEPFNEVLKFLGLKHYKIAHFKKYNVGESYPLDKIMRNQLVDYFRPHNQRLYDHLNMDLGWENY